MTHHGALFLIHVAFQMGFATLLGLSSYMKTVPKEISVSQQWLMAPAFSLTTQEGDVAIASPSAWHHSAYLMTTWIYNDFFWASGTHVLTGFKAPNHSRL